MTKLLIILCVTFCLIAGSKSFAESPIEGNLFTYWQSGGLHQPDTIDETNDHINVSHVSANGLGDPTSISAVMSELAHAQSHGLKAIVDVWGFVLDISDDPDTFCPLAYEPDAETQFQDFVDEAIAQGYLVPGDPQASVITAFFVAEEPELCGLKDVNGEANPALEHAVDVIRDNPDTSDIPLWVHVHHNYSSALEGMKLFDWVSMTYHGAGTDEFLSRFIQMKNSLNQSQKVILLPQAAYGGGLDGYGSWHNPEEVMEWFITDDQTIGIIPYLWTHPDAVTAGTRDISTLKSAYTNIGGQMKANNVIDVDVICDLDPPSWDDFICEAMVTGGTPPYSYEWDNGDQGDTAEYSLRCPDPQSGDSYSEDAIVTVTDANSFFRVASDTMDCP